MYKKLGYMLLIFLFIVCFGCSKKTNPPVSPITQIDSENSVKTTTEGFEMLLTNGNVTESEKKFDTALQQDPNNKLHV
ncbi:MAG: hypothetical protein ABIB46_00470 [bacterium]